MLVFEMDKHAAKLPSNGNPLWKKVQRLNGSGRTVRLRYSLFPFA